MKRKNKRYSMLKILVYGNLLPGFRANLNDALQFCSIVNSGEPEIAENSGDFDLIVIGHNFDSAENIINFCEKIKQDKTTSNIPLVLLIEPNPASGFLEEAAASGINAFLRINSLSPEIKTLVNILIAGRERFDVFKTGKAAEPADSENNLTRYNYPVDLTGKTEAGQFIQFLEILPVASVIVTFDGKMMYGNQIMRNLFEIPNNVDINTMKSDGFWLDLTDRNDWIREIRDKGSVLWKSIRFKTSRYHQILANISSVAINFSGKHAILSIISDATEQQKILEALKESEEKYRLMFETAHEGIVIAQNYKFVYCNQMVFEITGYKPEELIGVSFLNVIHPEDQELLTRNYKRRLNGEKVEQGYEFRLVAKNGEIKWVTLTGALLNWNGSPATFNFLNDISKRKEAEEALKTSAMVLKELNATKDKLFSIIAHDLKSPFSSIIGFSSLLKEEGDTLDSNVITQYSEAIYTSATKTLDLLDNLLNWAKNQQGNLSVENKKLILYEVVQEVITQLNEVSTAKNIALINRLDTNLLVDADENILKVILRNLVDNAVKFTKAGGTIIIEAVLNTADICIRVTDSGIGISRENLEKIFDIGSGFSTRGTLNEKGTGLGLILCREFVEKLGGKIWVTSKEGTGSTFSFSLPVKN